jgi:RNA-directed DNA polymerase
VKAKVKATTNRTTNMSLTVLMHRLNPVLRGWTNYHRHGASAKTFAYLGAYTWRRVWCWLRKKHPTATVKDLQRRYLNRWWPEQDGVRLFNPAAVAITRYRYRGAAIPTPWATTTSTAA